MRIPRRILLSQTGGIVHKFWRAHDQKFLLENNAVKELYLKCVFYAKTHKVVQEKVQIHAFCVMNNHSHQLISYEGKSENLSNFMKIAHCKFGSIFNKLNKREGAVASGRPKTPLVQKGSSHEMRVHFYIEANPVRARITKNLKHYRFSSYRYYAYGEKDRYTEQLIPPRWYLSLGKSDKERQAKYRSLFAKYLRETSEFIVEFINTKFLGDYVWKIDLEEKIRLLLEKKVGPPWIVPSSDGFESLV